jgi:hypothetical protein
MVADSTSASPHASIAAPRGRRRSEIRWRRRVATVALAVAVALLVTVGRGEAQTFVPKTFTQLVAEAEQAFVGPVVATASRRLASGLIVTDVTFAPVRGIKGSVPPAVVLEVAGGTAGGRTLRLAGVPSFEWGRSYLVFSKDNGTSIFPVVGGDQGMFRVEPDPVTGTLVVLDAGGRPVTRALVGGVPGAHALAGAPMTLDALVGEILARLSR